MRTPDKTPSAALADCLAAVGHRGPDSAARIVSKNRDLFRQWLSANGIPSATVTGMALATLREVWADASDKTLAMWQASSVPAIKSAADEPHKSTDDDKAEAARKALRDLIGATQLDEARVIELIGQHSIKTVRNELYIGSAKISTLSDEPHHAIFPELLAAVAAGLNVLLVGPAGSGKTHVCEQVAKALGVTYAYTGAIMQEHKIMGFLNAMGEQVATTYRKQYAEGGVFLFDEIDGSSAQALLAFNAGLANGSQDFPGGIVPRHKEFRCIASANTYGNGQNSQYVGRNQLDAATLDRFYVIPMGYDESMEAAVYGNAKPSPVSLFKPNPSAASDWLSYVHKMRRAAEASGQKVIISGRAIASGQKALAAGIPRHMVERAVMWKSLPADTIAKIKAAA